ncbi:hypothetical protein FBU30_006553 [Linnemannia zychae]|nr:hypothetical protein FBU30_006553 [Linnemannia zychae]
MNGVNGGRSSGLGWNHPNLSSPGRLDQTKKISDSSLHFQFQHGHRNNNASNGNTNINNGNNKGGTGGRLSTAGFRISGTIPRAGHDGLNDGYGHEFNNNYYNNSTNNISINSAAQQELMSMGTQQQQQPYKQQHQGPDPSKTSSIPPHHLLQANGRMSQQHHYTDHATNTGMRNSVSISNAPYTEEGMVTSIAAMNLTDRQQNMRIVQGQYQDSQQRNLTMPPYQQQQQQYQQGSSNSRQGSMLNTPGVSPTPFSTRNDHQPCRPDEPHYTYQQDIGTYPSKQQQPYYHQQQQPRLTATYPADQQRERPSTNNNNYGSTPRPSNFLTTAGPLIDMGSSSSQRPPTADQVFARLARQFPTNPRETEKRERIFRWLGHIVESLTFNPNTEIPGFIIPVYPDELDHPESITYELDLMAPIAKPFRKAIDIYCASGDWAMDMAIKYPRTLVYALDSMLDTSHLPLRIPENCKFRIRDARDQEGEFDLVHQRLGAFRTPIQEWTPHFAEMRRLTRPGGWIQMAESDGMIVRAGLETAKVNRWVEQAALSSGLNPPQLMGALMPTVLGAGLINVECYDYSIPLGDWAGLRGQVAMKSYLEMVDSLREEIIDMNRLEEGLFEETIELMKMECQEEKAELIMRVICAQKPPITDDLWRTTR